MISVDKAKKIFRKNIDAPFTEIELKTIKDVEYKVDEEIKSKYGIGQKRISINLKLVNFRSYNVNHYRADVMFNYLKNLYSENGWKVDIIDGDTRDINSISWFNLSEK
jgi:hypothetical protein